MKLLLDTHLLLWAAGDPTRLSRTVHRLLSDGENELIFSHVSLWEVVIKQGLGRLDFQADARRLRQGLLDHSYRELAISSEHVFAVSSLPNLHRDPFDRLLVAQAVVEGATLLTTDAMVARYRGPVRKV